METIFGIIVLSIAVGAVFSLMTKKCQNSQGACCDGASSRKAQANDQGYVDPDKERAIDEMMSQGRDSQTSTRGRR